jgi:hypothetical protein
LDWESDILMSKISSDGGLCMKILKNIWQFLKEIWVESDPRKDAEMWRAETQVRRKDAKLEQTKKEKEKEKK